jgi:hypothetical protein
MKTLEEYLNQFKKDLKKIVEDDYPCEEIAARWISWPKEILTADLGEVNPRYLSGVQNTLLKQMMMNIQLPVDYEGYEYLTYPAAYKFLAFTYGTLNIHHPLYCEVDHRGQSYLDKFIQQKTLYVTSTGETYDHQNH